LADGGAVSTDEDRTVSRREFSADNVALEFARMEGIDLSDCLLATVLTIPFKGRVEFVIPQPVDQDLILRLHRHLRSAPQVEAVDVRVSAERGIILGLVLAEPIPPLHIIRQLPNADGIRISWEERAVRSSRRESLIGGIVLTFDQ
jgi:hypothetical protein